MQWYWWVAVLQLFLAVLAGIYVWRRAGFNLFYPFMGFGKVTLRKTIEFFALGWAGLLSQPSFCRQME